MKKILAVAIALMLALTATLTVSATVLNKDANEAPVLVSLSGEDLDLGGILDTVTGLLGGIDLGGIMDVLQSFRGAENLLMDLYDAPEEVLRCVGELQQL